MGSTSAAATAAAPPAVLAEAPSPSADNVEDGADIEDDCCAVNYESGDDGDADDDEDGADGETYGVHNDLRECFTLAELIAPFYRQCAAVVLMFDTGSAESFSQVRLGHRGGSAMF